MSRPTYKAARNLALEAATARMKAAGRTLPDTTDEAFIRRRFAQLMWNVEAADGGFVGLSDGQLEKRATELALPLDLVLTAAYAPGRWPQEMAAGCVSAVYRHTPDMGEISGFGGDYEKCCQNMLEAGCKWIETHPTPDLRGHSYKNIYGVMVADSADAKAMEAAITGLPSVTQYGLTGAMHQAVMWRLFYIASNGWQKYCEAARAHARKDAAA